MCAARPTHAQDDDALDQADAVVEQYLDSHHLRRLLVEHLRQRLDKSPQADRVPIAEKLGALYVDLLGEAETAEERAVWEDLSRQLIRSVPKADTYELQINLAKAQYLVAEEIAERDRVHMASAEDRTEAQRILRVVGPIFEDLGSNMHRRVDRLERDEKSGRVEDTETLQSQLVEARRLRSLAMYYAGWTMYYQAMLTGATQYATAAIKDFGWLLNAPKGKPAAPDRLPVALLRYEHVARASMGVALCESLRGNDDRALRWLDMIEQADDLNEAVAAQMFSRRLVVLSAAHRWADIELLVRRKRQPYPDGPITPLPVNEASLLAVLMLDAIEADGPRQLRKELLPELAQDGLADLVTHGEIKHLLDLVSRYGTTPIGEEGFIVQYVRGFNAYENARDEHAAIGQDTDEPATDEAVVNRYLEAAASLEIACNAEDADRFASERINARLVLGLSLYYAGKLEEAADRFEQAAKQAGDPEKAEEALWLALVALDRAVENNRPSLTDRRDRVATLYLQSYPRSERAARILLRQATSELLTPKQAVEILLGVPADSALYESARRHAARLLYRVYRATPRRQRQFAAIRFVEVAEEVMDIDRRLVIAGGSDEAHEAAERVVLLSRQVTDALLGADAPDAERAAAALAILDDVLLREQINDSAFHDELEFRRLQIALLRGDMSAVDQHAAELRRLGGRFSDAADTLLYEWALKRWRENPDEIDAARRVTDYGVRVIARFGSNAAALSDPAIEQLHNTVADAAATIWRTAHDVAMRDLALRIDRLLIDTGRQPAVVLRRFAELAENAGEIQPALDAWRTLLNGYPQDTPLWYEARYQSLRLLLTVDPARARWVMDQYKILNPDFGPKPWGDRLRQLDEQTPPPVPPAEPTPPGNGSTTGSNGGGGQ